MVLSITFVSPSLSWLIYWQLLRLPFCCALSTAFGFETSSSFWVVLLFEMNQIPHAFIAFCQPSLLASCSLADSLI